MMGSATANGRGEPIEDITTTALQSPEMARIADEKIRNSVTAVRNWVEERNYKGYDPGDGLTSYLRPLTFGNILAERILQQLVWKAPINIRPLAGIVPMESTKGRGFMAWG